jgi:hypothetical protein
MASAKLNFSPWNARSILAKRVIREYTTMTCCNIKSARGNCFDGFESHWNEKPAGFLGELGEKAEAGKYE